MRDAARAAYADQRLETIDALPINPPGKVLRRELTAWLAEKDRGAARARP